jgi:glycogen operon protein
MSGSCYPLGATFDGKGVNFALFSANAEKVELCLFDPQGVEELNKIPLTEHENNIWHIYLEGILPEQVYGYRVYGPYKPLEGKRFNPNKLLFDPYAKKMIGQLIWHKAIFGYDTDSPDGDLSFSTLDSAPYVPKSVVVDDRFFDWEDDKRPQTPFAESVLYEMHLKSYTALFPKIKDALRGKFLALADPHITHYLKWLGVTAVELLPVQTFFREKHRHSRVNYWGYETFNFFAPENAYLANGDINEFKQMVKRLHANGLEVILDVVYNHTGEGNQLGPTLCYRGIDNESYYTLDKSNKRFYYDSTGCGALFNLQNPYVLTLVTDSLRYWCQKMHVDGFRLDLATSLSRVQNSFSQQSGFLTAVRQDDTLRQVKMIAEPWDVGFDGYQIGAFPPSWGEWNDRFRDVIRRFWRGDDRQIGEFASRIAGSSDIFGYHDRPIWTSINFITAHDGFNLKDLVSYDHKHNFSNQENNRDGSDQNWSWNSGVEGASDDVAVNENRLLRRRALMATLLLSFGTPMLFSGDELGQSHFGNNNPYCQDNVLNWLVWEAVSSSDRDFACYVRRLIRCRKRLKIFDRSAFFSGRKALKSPFKDLAWYHEKGGELTGEDWADPTRRSIASLVYAQDKLLLCIFNAQDKNVLWKLPPLKKTKKWHLLIDSSEHFQDQTPLAASKTIEVPAWCVLAIEINI